MVQQKGSKKTKTTKTTKTGGEKTKAPVQLNQTNMKATDGIVWHFPKMLPYNLSR